MVMHVWKINVNKTWLVYHGFWVTCAWLYWLKYRL